MKRINANVGGFYTDVESTKANFRNFFADVGMTWRVNFQQENALICLCKSILFRKLTKEQKAKLNQSFAASRNPYKATIAALVSELQLEKDRLKEFFETCRRKMGFLVILHSMKKKLNQYCWRFLRRIQCSTIMRSFD
ncbi:unnamed protein product [Caenorhabditis nigoni]